MPDFSAHGSNSRLPRPGNPESLELGQERWNSAIARLADESLESRARAVLEIGENASILQAIFGHSPYLTAVAAGNAGFTIQLFEDGPSETLATLLKKISQPAAEETEDGLKRRLRVLKQQASLAIAVADISNAWPLEQITEGLSDVAETCLRAAVTFALKESARRGAVTLPHSDDPERESGLIVLGMGKLGGRELNYSSDIDIIILFDPDVMQTETPDGLQNAMIRLARLVVKIMDERTVDGYVFRTDLRLRPDPSATPLALSVLAAESYYESLGQNWERAAMIKARPVAGDMDAGVQFLEWLRPFIWRKSLDFAAIQDIHSIKRQINAHRGGGEIKTAGHNVKLGAGGIREIEFFAQTQQLIWGGRLPDLRLRRTKETIDILVHHEQVDPDTSADMKSAYDFLRRVEHRLQMVKDEQTHLLPDDADAMDGFARFLGYDAGADFETELIAHLTRVQAHYSALFGDAPALSAGGDLGGNLVFTGSDADPDTLETLRSLGFREPARADAQIRAWHHGRYRAMRSTRARELLTELLPVLLAAMAETPEPDETFLRFDNFLKALPAGVQLFSMFHSNPHLSQLVVEIIGKAPRLARHMGNNASVLDSVLTSDFFDAPPDLQTMSRELEIAFRACRDMEDILVTSRRWANDRRFQVGVLRLGNNISPTDASAALSDIAEAALRGLLPRVAEEFQETHGKVPGGDIAVIALGRLGSREMSAASDLDLIFVYEVPQDAQSSDGVKPLAPSLYFNRLTQRCINALTAMTQEGALYDVDMRLRPSGSKGPIATSLTAFRQYHAESAWTWERMALVRGRVVADTGGIGAKVEATIADILSDQIEATKLLRDAAQMRARLAGEKTTDCIWEVKNLRGGLVDIAFLAQYLSLNHADARPPVRHPNTRRTLENLKHANLLSPSDADTLLAAQDLWMGLLGILALTIEGDLTTEKEAQISGALAVDLVRVGGALDFDDLKRKVITTAEAVFEIYRRVIDIPAADLPPADAIDEMPTEFPL